MARIPADELERLKSEVSVQRLAEARGIVLRPHGKDLLGLCPFHEDREPSLVISPDKNLWNCLGACGTGGSVIDWVMKAEKVSFRHAVEILREGIVSSDSVVTAKRATIRKLPSPVSFDAADWELLAQVVGFYHQSLKDSPEALHYLESRGLTHPEMIDHFQLGYANRLLGIRLPEGGRKAGREIRDRLLRVGILRETGHEHFNGSIVFPIFDDHGHVSEIYGRKVRNDLRAGTAYHLYLPGPHKGVFNAQALSASPDVILCESIIDALTFWCAGIRNVTTSYGVNGFTPDILEAFKKAGIKRVFVAYDRDPAGNKAAETLGKKLVEEGFECFRVLFPKGQDANDYAQKMKPARKALELAVRHAQWIGGTGKETAGNGAEIEDSAGRPSAGRPSAPLETPVQAAKEKNTEEPPEPEQLPESCEEATQVFPLAAETETPKTSPASPEVEIRANEIIMSLGAGSGRPRRWRVRGLEKNMSYDQLKVNLLVSRDDAYFVDTLDLYSARSRATFQKDAAAELRIDADVIRSDLGKLLLELEGLQDKRIRESLEPKEKAVVLTETERDEAMELLKDPALVRRILSDFEACGIVGEEINKLTGYLAAVSRKLETPLAVIIQSSSAAGKTSLMEAVLAFIPEEDRVKYSAMTGQSLFYMGETNLKHKILAIVEEEGAERASYALKLLQSEGELTIASTGKDPQTGRLVTHEYRVEGPVMIFVTTTSINIDEELQNRCLVLTVNESREQTRAIHQRQRARRTLEGLRARKEKARILRRHRNAQRLLRPFAVINPYAPRLTFLDDRTRTRRDHDRYLDLIEAIALLHQYQRALKTDHDEGKPYQYVEVTLEDIELANSLMHEVLGRSLDELPPQTRRFLLLLEAMVREGCEKEGIDRTAYRFHRRKILDVIGWSYDQVRVHLERLTELEYVLVHRGYQGLRFEYELLYNGQGRDGTPFYSGLIDTAAIRRTMTEALGGSGGTLGGETPDFGGRLGPAWGPFGGPLGGAVTPHGASVSGQNSEESLKKAQKGGNGKNRSYPLHNSVSTPTGSGSPGNGSGATMGKPD